MVVLHIVCLVQVKILERVREGDGCTAALKNDAAAVAEPALVWLWAPSTWSPQ